ncbi:MAG TPA: polyprenyl synthetase family protein, partial [Caulobacteraceae bacterium]|nr:polyprenyl synthetase family protein [Caulobacteraceae bacterium]
DSTAGVVAPLASGGRMDDTGMFLHSVEALRLHVDRRLAELIPAPAEEPGRLGEAAHYALLAPGKRFRPLLTLLTAEAFGSPIARALDVACAMEMVHAASLVLDDLPSMDDARLRRGRPTTHRVYGEADAILASVGLLTRAFGVIAAADCLPAEHRSELVMSLAEAVGFNGLVAGQALDLAERNRPRTVAELDALNHRKTGVLMMAAAEAGALIGGADPAARRELGEFARRIGLAFQIRDDLIDVDGGDHVGKDIGKDAGMTTVVSALGPRAAVAAIETHLAAADAALAKAGCDGRLGAFARSLFSGRKAAA